MVIFAREDFSNRPRTLNLVHTCSRCDSSDIIPTMVPGFIVPWYFEVPFCPRKSRSFWTSMNNTLTIVIFADGVVSDERSELAGIRSWDRRFTGDRLALHPALESAAITWCTYEYLEPCTLFFNDSMHVSTESMRQNATKKQTPDRRQYTN